MNNDDVSYVGQYLRVLDQQKSFLRAARIREGQIPPDRASRPSLVEGHEVASLHSKLRELNSDRNSAQPLIMSSFLFPPYPPSVASLDDLTPIHISDLRIGVQHRGRYLLVRAITQPNRMTAIVAVVEDQKKEAILLQLYRQPDEDVRPITSVLTKGDVLLVKEPFFKFVGNGKNGLRVDHITDVLWIDSRHKLFPSDWNLNKSQFTKSANAWKVEGNTAMGKKQYWKAIECYTVALESNPSNSESSIIRLNRALAYIQDGQFEAALIDIKNLDATLKSSEKALFRNAKALYGLGKFSECSTTLSILLQKYPDNKEAAKELSSARLRVSEQCTGEYDFKSMYKEATTMRPPHLDHATYVGPVIVKPSVGRGNGMFTTRAVKTGELLFCEKAFAYCYANNEVGSSKGSANTARLMNILTNQMTMGIQGNLVTKIVQKLLRNPSLLPDFNSLHHGSYEAVYATEVDGKPIIDTDLHLQTATATNDTRQLSSGSWLLASRINHSCFSNAHRSFLGDFQIVRATRDIATDTEVTFWYETPTGDQVDMRDGLQHWGFDCSCIICEDARSTPKKLIKKRKELLGVFESTMKTSNVDPAKAERLLKAASETYKRSASEIPRLLLGQKYAEVAQLCSKEDDAVKCVAMALKSLESLGFVVKGAQLTSSPSESFRIVKRGITVDDVMKMMILLRHAYYVFSPDKFQIITECARPAYKICVGEVVTFKSYDPVDNMV